jgi:hypothetical protein
MASANHATIYKNANICFIQFKKCKFKDITQKSNNSFLQKCDYGRKYNIGCKLKLADLEHIRES